MGNTVAYIHVHEACRTGHIREVKRWIEAGKSVDVRDTTQKTPLHFAAQWGQEEVLDYLIHSGADVDAVDYVHDTALHMACYWGHPGCVEVLLGSKANLLVTDVYGNRPSDVFDHHVTPETVAAIRQIILDHHEMRSSPSRAKSNSNMANWGEGAGGSDGGDAASARTKAAMMKLDAHLEPREEGAGDVDDVTGAVEGRATSGDLEQPQQRPVGCQSPKLMRQKSRTFGLTANIDRRLLKSTLKTGSVDIHEAARLGNLAVLKWAIVEKGDDPDRRDSQGMTPLMWAAREGRYSCAKFLLNNGADINAQCLPLKWTPLHFATYYLRCSVVRLLIIHGADPTHEDANGRKPGKRFCTPRLIQGFRSRGRKNRVRRFLDGNLEMNIGDKHEVFQANAPLEAYEPQVTPVMAESDMDNDDDSPQPESRGLKKLIRRASLRRVSLGLNSLESNVMVTMHRRLSRLTNYLDRAGTGHSQSLTKVAPVAQDLNDTIGSDNAIAEYDMNKDYHHVHHNDRKAIGGDMARDEGESARGAAGDTGGGGGGDVEKEKELLQTQHNSVSGGKVQDSHAHHPSELLHYHEPLHQQGKGGKSSFARMQKAMGTALIQLGEAMHGVPAAEDLAIEEVGIIRSLETVTRADLSSKGKHMTKTRRTSSSDLSSAPPAAATATTKTAASADGRQATHQSFAEPPDLRTNARMSRPVITLTADPKTASNMINNCIRRSSGSLGTAGVTAALEQERRVSAELDNREEQGAEHGVGNGGGGGGSGGRGGGRGGSNSQSFVDEERIEDLHLEGNHWKAINGRAKENKEGHNHSNRNDNNHSEHGTSQPANQSRRRQRPSEELSPATTALAPSEQSPAQSLFSPSSLLSATSLGSSFQSPPVAVTSSLTASREVWSPMVSSSKGEPQHQQFDQGSQTLGGGGGDGDGGGDSSGRGGCNGGGSSSTGGGGGGLKDGCEVIPIVNDDVDGVGSRVNASSNGTTNLTPTPMRVGKLETKQLPPLSVKNVTRQRVSNTDNTNEIDGGGGGGSGGSGGGVSVSQQRAKRRKRRKEKRKEPFSKAERQTDQTRQNGAAEGGGGGGGGSGSGDSDIIGVGGEVSSVKSSSTPLTCDDDN